LRWLKWTICAISIRGFSVGFGIKSKKEEKEENFANSPLWGLVENFKSFIFYLRLKSFSTVYTYST